MALDDLDRRIVVALQADGRASWTDIADQAGTTVATVARRAQSLFARGTLRVGVVADVHHAGPAELFVLRVRCEPAQQLVVAQRLAEQSNIRFVALTAGPSDVIAEMACVKDEIIRLITDVQTIPGVERCESDMVLHTYKIAHDWSRALLAGQGYQTRSRPPHDCDPSHFDELNLRIVDAMRNDGRVGFKAVAAQLKVNESTVRRRFELMTEQGCVHVVTIVSSAALGFEYETLLEIEVLPARLESVAASLSQFVGIRYLAGTLRSSSLFCELILPTTAEVHTFLTAELAQLDGVLGWTAYTELMALKRGFVETPWWRDQLAPSDDATTSGPDGGRVDSAHEPKASGELSEGARRLTRAARSRS